MDTLLVEALRAGVDVLTFWNLTPAETVQTIEAAAWRERQERKARLSLAWHTAALSRAKRMPSHERLLKPPPTPEELAQMKRDHSQMVEAWNKSNAGRNRTG